MTDYIKNNKTLVFIIAILLISNMALLFFFVKGDRRKEGDRDKRTEMSTRDFMAQTLKDSVGFTDDQVAKYKELSIAHKKSIKPLFDEIRQTKDSLYRILVQQNVADSVVNSLLDKIGEDQRNIDQKIFMHFRTLKTICTADQEAKFDSVTQHIIKHMIAGPSRRGGDRDRKK
ncbi:MAG: hypothetical protein GC171_11230 [Terrimonas sp.]|nr:hypothetical protein [Terrimonas sp.]